MPSDPSLHILSSFDSELAQLRIDVIQMGNLALRAVDGAINGLLDGKIERCSDVIADDEVIDQKQKTIDARGMAILLKFNPVASDFRAAVSSLSICRSLERIGDHAVNVSKSGRKILKHGSCPEVGLVKPLFDETRVLLVKSLQSYTNSDADLAMEVIAGDKQVDKLHKQLSKGLTTMVGNGGSDVESILHILFISRFLERIGDLAANIGEDVVFIHSAEDVRHA
ncbi:phosphate signaling complex protein PhoU [Luteolibacter sp. AS25]|uniref:phosphate signaling complex protein PhoU n=1 Tax=Luteolibacter sp. AS25 TaxID=3135776 RepID=UPI00398B1A91